MNRERLEALDVKLIHKASVEMHGFVWRILLDPETDNWFYAHDAGPLCGPRDKLGECLSAIEQEPEISRREQEAAKRGA